MTGTQRSIKVLYRSILKSHNLLINHSITCLKFNHMLITLSGILLGFAVVFGSPAPLFANYTLILNNGRTITVEAYKEKGGMIIFSSYGGEISIAKEDVQSIIPAVGRTGRTDLPEVEYVPGENGMAAPDPETVARPSEVPPLATKEKVLTPEEIKAEEKAKEEKEYQKRVSDITERIKALMDRYAIATRGKSGPEPSLLNSQEAIRSRTADLNSRLKDAQRIRTLLTPVRLGGQYRLGPKEKAGVKLEKPSPFHGKPPETILLRPGAVTSRVDSPLPPYSAKEKRLSDLRKQILDLQHDRDRLIQEMRNRNFDTASLFLE